MNAKLTAALLILAAVLANVGFTALGSIFNYPDVLDEPAGEVLADFRDNEGAVSGWFTVLALSAALLAPIAIGVGRLSAHRAMRIAVPVGIAAAVVQVVGLLRWPILVPGYASDAASADPASRPPPATRSRPRATSSAPRSARRSATSSPPRGPCSSSSRSAAASPAAGSRCSAAASAALVARRRLLAARAARRSTPRTSSATSCGASGSSRSRVVILVRERRAAAPRRAARGVTARGGVVTARARGAGSRSACSA